MLAKLSEKIGRLNALAILLINGTLREDQIAEITIDERIALENLFPQLKNLEIKPFQVILDEFKIADEESEERSKLLEEALQWAVMFDQLLDLYLSCNKQEESIVLERLLPKLTDMDKITYLWNIMHDASEKQRDAVFARALKMADTVFNEKNKMQITYRILILKGQSLTQKRKILLRMATLLRKEI